MSVMAKVHKAITPNPFRSSEAQFRNDWRFCQVKLNGEIANQKRICFASAQDGYIEHYLYADGRISTDDKGQPLTARLEGEVEIAAPAHYSVCPDCLSNWKRNPWWELAA